MSDQSSPCQRISSEGISHVFFVEISKELGCPLKVASAVVGKIFTTIRKSLTFEQASGWIGKLPDLLQLHFVREWPYSEKQLDLSHLDLLVDAVYAEDRNSERVFSSEIETLNAVITVLSKLDRMINLLSFPGFRFSFTQEVRQALLEPAA